MKNKWYKLSIGTILIIIALTMLSMFIYYEYKYDLSFSNKFCESKGYKSFSGVDYQVIGETGELVVNGISCKDKIGVYHIIKAS